LPLRAPPPHRRGMDRLRTAGRRQPGARRGRRWAVRSPESARRLLVALFALLLVQATGAPAAARAGPLPGPVPTPGRVGAPSTPPDAPAVGATVYGWPLRPDPPVEVAFREPTHRFG